MNKDESDKIFAPKEYRTVVIDSNCYVKIFYQDRPAAAFFDVIFFKDDEEYFLGRFPKSFDNFNVKYNEDKILICEEKYNSEEQKMNPVKVYSLYDIIEDIFYSVKEEDALKIFDSNISTKDLKNKNMQIHRQDCEKIRRLKRAK